MLLIPNVVINPRIEVKKIFRYLGAKTEDSILTIKNNIPLEFNINDYSGSIVRVKEIKVIDNHAGGPFGMWDVDADVYPILMTVNDSSEVPYEFAFKTVFNGVRDGDKLTLGEGITISRAYTKMPRFLDIHCIIMKSEERSRNIAKAINEAVNSEDGKSVTGTINTLVSAANPVYGAITSAATSLLSIVTSVLSKEEDEQIFYGVTSLEAYPDNLGIGKTFTLTDKKNAEVVLEVVGQK